MDLLGVDRAQEQLLEGSAAAADRGEPTSGDRHSEAGTGGRAPRAETRRPLDVEFEQRSGDPAEELERVAATATAPLIAVGSRGLGPPRSPLLGPIARRLLQHARRPIMVVPATSSPAALAA